MCKSGLDPIELSTTSLVYILFGGKVWLVFVYCLDSEDKIVWSGQCILRSDRLLGK